MHIAHGVKPENIQLALVVHGGASVDVLENSFYKKRFDSDNKNQQLIYNCWHIIPLCMCVGSLQRT